MPKGTYDPERASRITDATLEVVRQRGVEGLTHRAVAAAAGVPLGSTTYHFKSVDGLLAAALGRAKDTTHAELEELSARVDAGSDLVTTLTEHLVELAGSELPRVIVEHELYLAALRRESLRPLSVSWANDLPDMLSRHTDSTTAQALAYVFDGVLLQSVLQGKPRPRDEIETFLRRALNSMG